MRRITRTASKLIAIIILFQLFATVGTVGQNIRRDGLNFIEDRDRPPEKTKLTFTDSNGKTHPVYVMYVKSNWVFFIYIVSKTGKTTKYIFPKKTQNKMFFAYLDSHPFDHQKH